MEKAFYIDGLLPPPSNQAPVKAAEGQGPVKLQSVDNEVSDRSDKSAPEATPSPDLPVFKLPSPVPPPVPPAESLSLSIPQAKRARQGAIRHIVGSDSDLGHASSEDVSELARHSPISKILENGSTDLHGTTDGTTTDSGAEDMIEEMLLESPPTSTPLRAILSAAAAEALPAEIAHPSIAAATTLIIGAARTLTLSVAAYSPPDDCPGTPPRRTGPRPRQRLPGDLPAEPPEVRMATQLRRQSARLNAVHELHSQISTAPKLIKPTTKVPPKTKMSAKTKPTH